MNSGAKVEKNFEKDAAAFKETKIVSCGFRIEPELEIYFRKKRNKKTKIICFY